MGNKTDATMTEIGPYKLKLQPRECEQCGGKYIPTGTRQRLCPACAAGRKHNPKYTEARTPGEVLSYKMEKPETPEASQQPEAPEEITRQVIETPEAGPWYEVRVRIGDTVTIDTKISQEALARIIKEVR